MHTAFTGEHYFNLMFQFMNQPTIVDKQYQC